MSLFYIDEADELNELVQRMSDRQYEQSPGLYDDLPERARRFMKRDFYYGVSYLFTALKLKKEAVFTSYIRWTYDYLSYLMLYVPRETMTAQIKDFYEAMRYCMADEVDEDERELVHAYFDHAADLIDRMGREEAHQGSGQHLEYEAEVREYLDLILQNRTRDALSFFKELETRGFDVDTIYVQIVQEVMHRIGELWFENKINVAQEHYATATTQMAMSQLYPSIFSVPSNSRTVIGCCMGGELHEMGMRVIMDLFTNHGYNSVFLGAGVPMESLLKKIEEQKPNLLALSVTMPQHLALCRDTIKMIKKERPDVLIAVGGRAFRDVDDEWSRWGADIYTEDAKELIKWTDKKLGLTEIS